MNFANQQQQQQQQLFTGAEPQAMPQFPPGANSNNNGMDGLMGYSNNMNGNNMNNFPQQQLQLQQQQAAFGNSNNAMSSLPPSSMMVAPSTFNPNNKVMPAMNANLLPPMQALEQQSNTITNNNTIMNNNGQTATAGPLIDSQSGLQNLLNILLHQNNIQAAPAPTPTAPPSSSNLLDMLSALIQAAPGTNTGCGPSMMSPPPPQQQQQHQQQPAPSSLPPLPHQFPAGNHQPHQQMNSNSMMMSGIPPPAQHPTNSSVVSVNSSSNATIPQDINLMIQNLQNQIAAATAATSTAVGGGAGAERQDEKLTFSPRTLVLEEGRLAQQQQSSCSNSSQKKTLPQGTLVPPPPALAKGTGSATAAAPSKVAGESREIRLYRDIDDFYLTEYQCLLRQHIELFEATVNDVQASAQGRNSPIEIGQVGIRCVHCRTMHIKCRSRGAVYFPRSIDGIYQVAQNLTKIHLCQGCTRVPDSLRKRLLKLSKVNKRASGGKRYWNERVRELGIVEDGKGIRFKTGSS